MTVFITYYMDEHYATQVAIVNSFEEAEAYLIWFGVDDAQIIEAVTKETQGE